MHFDLSGWATDSGLNDIRDVREVKALTMILTEMNHKNLPRAADLIAMRIREIKNAKVSGSSWEKAAAGSLLPCDQPSPTPLQDMFLAP